MATRVAQPSLLDGGPPAVDRGRLAAIGRLQLDDDAWVDHLPGWMAGHHDLFEELVRTTCWRQEQRKMYDRTVDVPRLIATLPAEGPGHPVLEEARRLLSAHYGVDFGSPSLGFYRDGRDSVAWHGDYVARNTARAHVASVSLGEPRRFLLKRRAAGGRSIAYTLGWGDLLVMGGACQRTWQHCIPKVSDAGPRIAVVFRDFSPKQYRWVTGS
jgi:alkylated DNA repair dioxygenase AlkB